MVIGPLADSELGTDEGLNKQPSLHYYSRMRFVRGLLPQLTQLGQWKSQRSAMSRVASISKEWRGTFEHG